MQNDQSGQNNQYGQNAPYGAQNNHYGVQSNPYDPNNAAYPSSAYPNAPYPNSAYPNAPYPQVQYGPAVQPAPYPNAPYPNSAYPNAPYPQVQYGPAVQPAPYQQNAPYQQAPSAVNSGKSKKTAMIFCIISNVLMVLGVLAIPFLFVMILAMGFGAVGDTFYTAFLIAAACALGPIASLAFAIAAKVKNRKSIWAVVNMVISTILILAPVAIGIIYVNDRKNNPKTPAVSSSYYAYENPYYEEMNACLEEHDFDVVMKNDTGRKQAGDSHLYSYTLRIYVSSEASEEKRSEVTGYLRQMRDICIKTDETGKYPGGMRVILEFYYFDPDNEEEIYHPYINLYILADTPDDEIDVENYIDMALSVAPSRGSVRDKPVNEDVLIVVN